MGSHGYVSVSYCLRQGTFEGDGPYWSISTKCNSSRGEVPGLRRPSFSLYCGGYFETSDERWADELVSSLMTLGSNFAQQRDSTVMAIIAAHGIRAQARWPERGDGDGRPEGHLLESHLRGRARESRRAVETRGSPRRAARDRM